jgi:CubicO group peptidase (beta-lactamase class C family)
MNDPLRITPDRLQTATAYHAEHRGLALVVRQHGELIWEDFAQTEHRNRALPVASGTKSFAGILAATAAADGLLRLDELLCSTLTEWASDPRRSRITVRELLHLVSGLPAGGKPGHVPDFASALQTQLVTDPGTRFFYGAAPFQVFGEFVRRKLNHVCADPLDYLYGRVLDRIGLQTGRWRRGPDGWPDLSSGLSVAATEWIKLGTWILQRGHWEGVEIVPETHLDLCFIGSKENPAYGLGWWLNRSLPDQTRTQLTQATLGLEDLTHETAVPADLVYSAGAGKQRLYVSRTRNLVIVRQAAGIIEALAGGERSPFSDREFFTLLFP